jgi:hypothetical protein
MRLPEILTKLVWHCGRNRHHRFLLQDPCHVLFSFRAGFGTVTPSMISAIKYESLES